MDTLRTCPVCQSTFVAHGVQKYCSLACRPSLSKRRIHCIVCEKMFVPSSKKQRTCSRECHRQWQVQMVCMPRTGNGLSQAHSPEQSRAQGGYWKDLTLFAQRMAYTLNGTTWWATPCCYCGDPAEAEEHVFPQAAFKKLSAVGRVMIPDDVLRIVPVCHECNSLLSDKIFTSFEEKRLYAKGALSYRYRRVLSYPAWDEDELSQLSGPLQTWIADGQAVRDLVFERLRF